jgi:serine-type D-Ala-D-Ala carboxypeptidase/endopeptidase (penicillin-binding protein 4)
VLAAVCAVASAVSADLAPASLGGPVVALDDGGRTPVAREGSELASRRALERGELRARLRRALRSAGGDAGAWVFEASARRRPRVYASRAKDRKVPASNQKLFTTAAVLGRFGARGHLETVVHARGETGPGGRALDGSLVLVGAGDPALGARSFARRHGLPLTPIADLATDIRQAGIRRVSGDLKVDDSVFDDRQGVGSTGWHAGPYLSPLSGLSFNSGYRRGHYAGSPEKVAGQELKASLRRNGVRVEGRVGHGEARPDLLAQEPLARVRSPSIANLVTATNRPSNNFFAEMLLKRLAAEDDRVGTTKRGARKAERFARSLAMGDDAADGSGLGRGNRASPRQVGSLLVAMLEQPAGSAFRQSLPLAGREGTVASRMRGTAAEGRCRAKTGTLAGVSALSGYCRAGEGTVAFSILMNGVDVYAARRAQDAMAAAIARYR